MHLNVHPIPNYQEIFFKKSFRVFFFLQFQQAKNLYKMHFHILCLSRHLWCSDSTWEACVNYCHTKCCCFKFQLVVDSVTQCYFILQSYITFYDISDPWIIRSHLELDGSPHFTTFEKVENSLWTLWNKSLQSN